MGAKGGGEAGTIGAPPAVINALVDALRQGLQLVVISLGGDEDSQVIFETLNARGTPLTAADLVPMHDVVTGVFMPPADRPLVFKSVGMSWQDLVVAEAVLAGSAVDR